MGDSWSIYAIILCILYGIINVSHYTHSVSYAGIIYGLDTSCYTLNCIDSGSGVCCLSGTRWLASDRQPSINWLSVNPEGLNERNITASVMRYIHKMENTRLGVEW